MKKRKNNKGFTLVEILAAVTIMGILAAIAIPAVYRYVTKSRNLSYDSMYNSVYDAVKNYRINTNDDTSKGRNESTYSRDEINKLIEWKYLEPLIDPADREKKCTSEVYIYNCIDSDNLDTLNGYLYTVMLKCSVHSGSKTFDDTGELLSISEQNECLGTSDFVVDEENIKMKYDDQNGADYHGELTNHNVWIGNFSIKSGNEIDYYEYTFDIDNPFTTNVNLFDGDAITQGYTFTTDINKSFRIRAVDVNGNVGGWSEKVYKVNIDKTPPDVTMKMINVSNGFTSKFNGMGTDDKPNVYDHSASGWVTKGSNGKNAQISISATDVSGLKDTVYIWYNVATMSDFSTSKNTSTGDKKFTNGKYTTGKISDGFRIIKCIVTDKAGNQTTGTIKFKLDTVPPTITMNLVNDEDKKLGSNCVCKESSCNCSYPSNDSTNLKWLTTTNVYDKVSATDNSGVVNIKAGYNKYGSNKKNTNIPDENWSNRGNNSKSITISDGYRYMEYIATDPAGNTTKIKYTVKKDSKPPTGSVTVKYDDVSQKIEKQLTFKNVITSSISLDIAAEDKISGVTSMFYINYNDAGKETCEIDEKVNSASKYYYSENSNGKKTRTIDKALSDGCRYFYVTLKDNAGNSKIIKVKLNKRFSKVGCYYYDYYIRRYYNKFDTTNTLSNKNKWACQCGENHNEGHYIVCKTEDGKFYGKRQALKSKSSASPTLICREAPMGYKASVEQEKFWILDKEISDTIVWSSDYYAKVTRKCKKEGPSKNYGNEDLCGS